MSTGNAEQDKERLAQFVEAASTKFKLEDKDANTKLLIIGEREFPFPIPIVKKGEGWAFDPVAGQREIRARLIGHNELAAMSACCAYMAAQKDYIKSDRDGDRVLEYAQRIISTPGSRTDSTGSRNRSRTSVRSKARCRMRFARRACGRAILRGLYVPHPEGAGAGGAGRGL